MSFFKFLSHPPQPAIRPIFHPYDLKLESRVANEAAIRGLTHNAYLGENLSLCRVLGRYKMYVDTRDISISSHLLLDGFWEMWVTEAMVSLIRPGMVVADIGANLGYFTVLMSDLVGAAGKVHAFEPNPEMAWRLKKSLHVSGLDARAELHQVLLGGSEGEQMTLHILDHAPGGAFMAPTTDVDVDAGATILSTCRLDSRPDWRLIEFAKIDVEGAEELVWDGAEQLLQGPALKTVMLEFVPGRYQDASGFIDRITAHGFRLEVISPVEGIQPITRAGLLDEGCDPEVMLLLRR